MKNENAVRHCINHPVSEYEKKMKNDKPAV